MAKQKVLWAPTPKQDLFLSCPADEVLYGGAAGGGKSDALIFCAVGDAEVNVFNNGNWRALVLRRTFPELEKTLIMRSLHLFHGKSKYDGVKHRHTFQSGGIIQFGHIKNEEDVVRHQGAEYNVICFDELTHFTERMYMYLHSRLRTTDPTIRCRVRSASNPGGLGHGWVKKRFIDVIEPYEIYKEVFVLPDGNQKISTRCYIPATVYDNSHLMDNDPGYVQRLMGLPDTERKAFLNGDWNIFSGQFFTEFGEWNICEPFDIPYGWPVWVSMDYGYATKCAIGFYAQDPQSHVYYRFSEIYVSKTHPDVLSKMIKDRLGKHFVNVVGKFGDRRIMVKDENTELSTKEKFAHNGLYFQLAKDDRVEGWRRARELFIRDLDGHVRFKVFKNCEHFIRVIPEMIHDINNPEDVDKNCEAHIADEFRYFSIMRKVSDYEREPELAMSYNPVTGYPGVFGNQSNLRDRLPRLNIKAGINYFLDKPEEDEDDLR